MSVFSQIPKPKFPPKTVTLPNRAWVADYEGRPSGDVTIGLRHVSEADIAAARSDAATKALEMHPREADQDRIDCFNDLVIGNILARATCQAEDAAIGYFEMPEAQIRMAFTTDALRQLYDAYINMTIETSVLSPEADDDELVELSSLLLSEDAWLALQPVTARRLRRLAHHFLETLDPELREASA